MTGETLPLDTDALGVTSAPPSVLSWARLALAFFGSILAGAALLVALLVAIQVAYTGRALPGVSVGAVDIGGLTREAAAARLEAGLPRLNDGTLTLAIASETLTIGYAELGRDYDTDAMVELAFVVGRSGDPVARGIEELRALVRGASITPLIRWNEAAVAAALGAAAAGFDRAAVDGSVVRDDSGRFVATPATYGRRLDQAAAADEIRALLAAPDAPSATTVNLVVRPIVPHVLTGHAEYARHRAEVIASLDLATWEGSDEWVIPAEEVRSWIRFERAPLGGLHVDVIGTPLAASLTSLAKDVARKPKDAAFLTGKDGQIVGVVSGANGRTLDIADSMIAIAAAIDRYDEDAADPQALRVELAVIIKAPKLTTEEASRVAPLMTRIGTWTTHYIVGAGSYYGANISIPARIISGTVVPAGSWFSFWNTVGIPTEEQGYGPGGYILNGRSTLGALAGGICSTSTTLFNAAVRAGLQMGKRDNHYYYIPRYPMGLDATVWMSSWTSRQDMTFRNDTGNPILIRAINKYGVVRFDIYGVPDGRKVTFSKPIIKNLVKAKDTIVYTTEIPPGTEKRVEFPSDGMDVWVTRTVTRDGEVIHKETWFSDYRRVDGILWIGVEPEPEATPEPTPSASTTAVWA